MTAGTSPQNGSGCSLHQQLVDTLARIETNTAEATRTALVKVDSNERQILVLQKDLMSVIVGLKEAVESSKAQIAANTKVLEEVKAQLLLSNTQLSSNSEMTKEVLSLVNKILTKRATLPRPRPIHRSRRAR